jgi:hypothetical protein
MSNRRNHAFAVPQERAKATLAEMEKNDPNGMFGSTTAHCPRCGDAFMIIFSNDFDSDNHRYLELLVEQLGRTCQDGRHNVELPFATAKNA